MSSQALVPVRKKSRQSTESTTNSQSTTEQQQNSSKESSEEVLEATTKLLADIDRVLDQDAIANLKDQLKEVDPTEEKPLTLSQLMREGSSVTDQAIGQWVKPTGETCALSAAMLAARARGLA